MANYRLDIVTTASQEVALTIVNIRENERLLREWEGENLRRAAQEPPLPPLPPIVELTNLAYLLSRVVDILNSHVESVGAEEYETLRERYIAADESTRQTVKTALR